MADKTSADFVAGVKAAIGLLEARANEANRDPDSGDTFWGRSADALRVLLPKPPRLLEEAEALLERDWENTIRFLRANHAGYRADAIEKRIEALRAAVEREKAGAR